MLSTFNTPLFNQSLFNEGDSGPPCPKWDLGPLWQITTSCARKGMFGLSRIADGITADSDATSTQPITVLAGQQYYLSFWLKGDGTSNGVISFGFSFYNSSSSLISSEFIASSGSPTSWTNFQGNIIAPVGSVTAVAVVRATGHLVGTWCVDTLFASTAGGNFVLSWIKHYYDSYTLYR